MGFTRLIPLKSILRHLGPLIVFTSWSDRRDRGFSALLQVGYCRELCRRSTSQIYIPLNPGGGCETAPVKIIRQTTVVTNEVNSIPNETPLSFPLHIQTTRLRSTSLLKSPKGHILRAVLSQLLHSLLTFSQCLCCCLAHRTIPALGYIPPLSARPDPARGLPHRCTTSDKNVHAGTSNPLATCQPT